MARYHFHQQNHQQLPDPEGEELADLAAAKDAALKGFLEMVRDHRREFWDQRTWQMTVTDERGLTLFTLELSATPGPDADRAHD